MPDGHPLDLDRWPRRGIHDFFRRYEQPFLGICTEVAVTPTRQWCRATGQPFALACWFLCQRAVNAVEEFRHRLRPEGVWVHDRIRVSTTVPADHGAFRFCHLPYAADFASFRDGARRAMADGPPAGGALDDRPGDDATIHGSTLPWIRFTGLTHPWRQDPLDSVPRIVLGRAAPVGEEISMPVAVDAHHALVDGWHVARLLEHLTADLARPQEVLRG